MSGKNIVLTCLWRTDEFIVSDSKTAPSEDEAVLTIDEQQEKIIAKIPSHFSLITQRIIERRVSSIAKSGFTVPKSQIRIGAGFDVTILKEESIPDVLLQVGHQYIYGEKQPPKEEIQTSPQNRMKIRTDTEYVPTFLKQEERDTEVHTIARLEPEPASTITTESISEPEAKIEPTIIEEPSILDDNNEDVAGRFIVALSKISDIYLSRKKDHFSVEYSSGRVDFTIKKGKIDILLKKRIPDDDRTLDQALSEAIR